MIDRGHGFIGTHLEPFTHMLPLRADRFVGAKLAILAEPMKADVDTVKDGPDPEENLWVPAGYTYFGQFVDHDLTFDSTSSLNPQDNSGDHTRIPSNLRTPRFDLDNVYGDGPAAQPFMYADDGATLLYGGMGGPSSQVGGGGLVTYETASWDLLRAPNGRAIIGDKRNDENSIVCQIQLAFIKFHNAIVAALNLEEPSTWLVPNQLFESAQTEVRWTYQKILMEDFLPRIIRAEVLAPFAGKTPAERKDIYKLYLEPLRINLPREFVAAAYRYGHSGVRTGYRLNAQTSLTIFPSSDVSGQGVDSLLGFDPLPKSHVIDDWGRFFPHTAPGDDINDTGRVAAGDIPNPAVRLQFAYKFDPTIVDPLGVLPPSVAGGVTTGLIAAISPETLPDNAGRPSLALINLMRGNFYGIATGEEVADALIAKGSAVTKLASTELVVRVPSATPANAPQLFKWQPIDTYFNGQTPLWFYCLAEAQAPIVHALPLSADGTFPETLMLQGQGAQSQLGWVGGTIVAEVFYGLLDVDLASVEHAKKPFTPRIGSNGKIVLRDLLEFTA